MERPFWRGGGKDLSRNVILVGGTGGIVLVNSSEW